MVDGRSLTSEFSVIYTDCLNIDLTFIWDHCNYLLFTFKADIQKEHTVHLLFTFKADIGTHCTSPPRLSVIILYCNNIRSVFSCK